MVGGHRRGVTAPMTLKEECVTPGMPFALMGDTAGRWCDPHPCPVAHRQ